MEQEARWFKEWEIRTFGAGYGTGELPILTAVSIFFSLLEDARCYHHEVLEENLGPTVTWLLINAFDKADMIEWGTSARYGWLTSSGELLRSFFEKYSAQELYDILMSDAVRDVCLCDGQMEGHADCGQNPFVNEKLADELMFATERQR